MWWEFLTIGGHVGKGFWMMTCTKWMAVTCYPGTCLTQTVPGGTAVRMWPTPMSRSVRDALFCTMPHLLDQVELLPVGVKLAETKVPGTLDRPQTIQLIDYRRRRDWLTDRVTLRLCFKVKNNKGKPNKKNTFFFIIILIPIFSTIFFNKPNCRLYNGYKF